VRTRTVAGLKIYGTYLRPVGVPLYHEIVWEGKEANELNLDRCLPLPYHGYVLKLKSNPDLTPGKEPRIDPYFWASTVHLVLYRPRKMGTIRTV
jgi:hypothetical protein